jgi:sulfatase maturation enzyme AslB (radical SAM superfamily)
MYHNASLSHWLLKNNKKIFIPAHADIDLSNACNQDCFYCNSVDFRKKFSGQPKHTTYIKLLDQLSTWREHSSDSYGTLHTITYPGGGEPTLLKHYEQVIEHTIDLGFLTSITTNGSNLKPLYTNVSVEKLKKLAWVGIDIDSADKDIYELIRHSNNNKSLFNNVIENTKVLCEMGVNVDFKILLSKYNIKPQSIINLFELARELNVRMLYFRPTVMNNKAFNIYPTTIDFIQSCGKRYNIATKINTDKHLARNYTQCHQMFQFPVFCADQNMYTCCEHRGDPRFKLGNWVENDVRDFWQQQRHWDMYNDIDTTLCRPCRPNKNNIQMQDIIDNNNLLETLYM